LKSPEGAISYIAAALDLIAIIYEEGKSPGVCDPAIRVNPAILTNVYQGSDPVKWMARVKAIKPGEHLVAKNDMPIWLMLPRNIALVEDGVGSPSQSLSASENDGR
jgi:hypothetical protein